MNLEVHTLGFPNMLMISNPWKSGYFRSETCIANKCISVVCMNVYVNLRLLGRVQTNHYGSDVS